MKIKGLILASAMLFATGSHAATITPHLELLAGWDNVKLNGVHADGLTYQVQGGLDAKVSQRVFVGLEANYSRSTTKKSYNVYDLQGFNTSSRGDETDKAPESYYVGARLGFWATDKLAVYGKAGYRWSKAKSAFYYRFENQDGVYNETDRYHATTGGISAGLGAQMLLTRHFYIKGEGNWTRVHDSDVGNGHRIEIVGGAGYQF